MAAGTNRRCQFIRGEVRGARFCARRQNHAGLTATEHLLCCFNCTCASSVRTTTRSAGVFKRSKEKQRCIEVIFKRQDGECENSITLISKTRLLMRSSCQIVRMALFGVAELRAGTLDVADETGEMST